MRSLVSNSIYAKKDRNGPPSANQVASKDKPRRSHAACTLWVHPPTSPFPTLSGEFLVEVSITVIIGGKFKLQTISTHPQMYSNFDRIALTQLKFFYIQYPTGMLQNTPP